MVQCAPPSLVMRMAAFDVAPASNFPTTHPRSRLTNEILRISCVAPTSCRDVEHVSEPVAHPVTSSTSLVGGVRGRGAPAEHRGTGPDGVEGTRIVTAAGRRGASLLPGSLEHARPMPAAIDGVIAKVGRLGGSSLPDGEECPCLLTTTPADGGQVGPARAGEVAG